MRWDLRHVISYIFHFIIFFCSCWDWVGSLSLVTGRLPKKEFDSTVKKFVSDSASAVRCFEGTKKAWLEQYRNMKKVRKTLSKYQRRNLQAKQSMIFVCNASDLPTRNYLILLLVLQSIDSDSLTASSVESLRWFDGLYGVQLAAKPHKQAHMCDMVASFVETGHHAFDQLECWPDCAGRAVAIGWRLLFPFKTDWLTASYSRSL